MGSGLTGCFHVENNALFFQRIKRCNAALPRGNCAGAHRFPSLPLLVRVIICDVLAALATTSTPDTLRKVGRFAAGAQIITAGLSAISTRVNQFISAILYNRV